jgi:hypothetical protein
VSGGVWGIFALMVFGYGEVVVMVVGKDVCNSVEFLRAWRSSEYPSASPKVFAAWRVLPNG